MAERSSDDALLQNPILQDLHGSISQILRGIGCQSKADIIEQLVTDIDTDLITECREFCFRAAVAQYDEQLEDHGLSGKAKIELKLRRGESYMEKCAGDIIEMTLYVCGISQNFPKSIISCKSTYIEIAGKTPANADDKSHEKGLGSVVQVLNEKIDQQEVTISKLKDYVLNVETVLNDLIVDLRVNCDLKIKTSAALNELKDGLATRTTATMPTAKSSEQLTADVAGSINPTTPALNTGPNPSNSWIAENGLDERLISELISTQSTHGDGGACNLPCGQGCGARQKSQVSSSRPTNESIKHSVSIISPRSQTVVLPGDIIKRDNVGVQGAPPPPPPQPNAQASQQTDKLSYSAIAAALGDGDSGWQHQRHEKRRYNKYNKQSRDNNDNNRKATPAPLSGVKQERGVELYVQNIQRHAGDIFKDIADRVRSYCKAKGLRVMSARIIKIRASEDMVGCRITVPERQVDDALGDMWPADVKCRRWENKGGRRWQDNQRQRWGPDDVTRGRSSSRRRRDGKTPSRSRSRRRRDDRTPSRSRSRARRDRSRSRSPQGRGRSMTRRQPDTRFPSRSQSRHRSSSNAMHRGSDGGPGDAHKRSIHDNNSDYWWHRNQESDWEDDKNDSDRRGSDRYEWDHKRYTYRKTDY